MAFVTRATFQDKHVLQSENVPPTSWRVTTSLGVVVSTHVISTMTGSIIVSKEISNKSWKEAQLRKYGNLKSIATTFERQFIRDYWNDVSAWDDRKRQR